MNTITSDLILLQLYFPYYSKKSKSRFESFFQSLPINITKIKISSKIFPEKIIQGTDKRSSVVLKNIPILFTKNILRSIIESFGNINFLHINKVKQNNNNSNNYKNDENSKNSNTNNNNQNNENLSNNVYVNFINYKSIVNMYMFMKKSENNSLSNIGMYYSKVQGKHNLKKKFKDSNNKP